ncbi:MAG TPA: BrnT family toxin [Terriglobia bacterium]|nr:BrnT family toxin [Terriglobia bacterium]
MVPVFSWNPDKARRNARKHAVTFEEAGSVLRDPLSVTIGDPLHSTEEYRFVTMGASDKGRVLVVVHSDFGEMIRIVSARLATRRERRGL